MSHHLLIFTCIAVLTAVTIDAVDNDKSKKSSHKKLWFPVSKDEFLFGERTPVWLAKNPNDDNPVVYSRVRKAIMKRSMIKWRKDGGETVKLDKAIDGYLETYDNNHVILDDLLYLSILVVMDYEGVWNKSDTTETPESRIKSMLIYAMAYFNNVDLLMRSAEPRVRIRVVGIVIGDGRESSPYIYDNISPSGYYDAESAILSSQKYWDNVSETHKDFSKKAYDCVVTLTELRRREPITYEVNEIHRRLYGSKFNILSIIVNDDKMFVGVDRTVYELHLIVYELPANDVERNLLINSQISLMPFLQFRYFSTHIITFFDNLLRPKEYHDPGKPLETILPGTVRPALQQCRARDIDEICWGPMTCGDLTCSGKGTPCTSIGRALEGTTCGKKQMCLAEKCTSRDELQLH